VNIHKNYLGTITLDKMVEYGGFITSAIQPGGIIVIESSENNYSLSEISQILESNQCQILSITVNSSPDSRKVIITVKVNKSDISSDLTALARYRYQVKFSVQETGFHDEAQERFESFMNYLNM
jgi:aspartokinase